MNGAGAPAWTGPRPELESAFKGKKVKTGKVCKKFSLSLDFQHRRLRGHRGKLNFLIPSVFNERNVKKDSAQGWVFCFYKV
jgi:hypothetical protein